ncbi:hypothetical protein UNDYM_1663 [Undibacterium sp. YM2]|uniref:hypothetical protein n=1 Tax=Undibacterium sp. YM2 TaxID=2058625 RepID=UPI001331F35F|nr:hypothetical protein [Undibacterium sp. YM2]BBB65916.1 hypothetical protein UNDYM_1663 [Undibacterium sp. YM2]
MNVGTLEIQLMANMARLQKDMEDAKRTVGGAMASIESAVNMAKAAITGLAAGMSVNAFIGLIRGAIEAKAGLQQLSEQTGSTVESLSALKSVAKLSDTSMENVAAVINKLSKSMVASKDPASAAAQAFKSLGISGQEIAANMDDPAKMLLVMAKHLDNFKDGAGKTTVELELMGKGVASILPMLKDLAEHNELVGKTTSAQAAEADKFEKIMVQMGGKWKGIYSIIADEILPTLNEFFGAMLKGGGIAKTLTEYVRQLAKEGKIREWAESARIAIEALMAVVKPATLIMAAYIAIFVAAPAVIGATTAAFTALYGVMGRFVVGMVAGQASTVGLNTALFGTSVAAEIAAGSLTKMAVLGGVLFAAFAGWQIGTVLREQFLEARLAGLTFIALMLKGWEDLRYGAEIAWEAIKFAWEKTINTMKVLFAGYLTTVATGLKTVGATAVASQVADYADGLRAAAASQKTFAEQTAGITAAHKQAISAIDDDIVATMAWEMANDKASKKAADVSDSIKKSKDEVKAASQGNTAANQKEQEAYNTLISAIKAKTEENRLELLIGENASESQKELIKLDQQLASGKLVLTAAHEAAVRAAIKEQESTEVMLKTRNAEKATLEWIIQSTKARNASKDALANEYAMYGKLNDEKEIALIALKAEAELEDEVNKRRKAGIPVTDEMLKRMKEESDLRVKIDQERTAQGKALGYAEQLATDNKRFIAENIYDEKERAAAILAIDAEVWSRRIAMAGEGTEAQKKLQKDYDIWYGNQSIKPSLEQQKNMLKSLDDTAHDTFVDIARNGKSAFDRVTDTLKSGLLDLLYQLTFKKWIINIGTSITGSLVSGAASAAGAAGAASSGLSLSSLIGAGANAISAAGTMFGSSAIAAFGGGLAATAGVDTGLAAMYASAATAGNLSAGAAAGGAVGSGLGSIGSTLAAIPGWGWAAMAAAAVAVLGQGKDRQLTGVGLSGQLGTQNITRDVSWTKDGGWFHSDTAGTWKYNLANSSTVVDGRSYTDSASQQSDQTLLKAITVQYDAMKKAAADYAKALGLDASYLENRTQNFSIALGTTTEEIQKNIAELFKNVGNDISKELLSLAPGLEKLAKEGESSSETVARLVTDIGNVNDTMRLLGETTYKLDVSGISAAENLVKLYGSLQNLESVSAAYYEKYYSAAEKAAIVTNNLTDQFKSVGYVLPDSLAQLRKWIEAAKDLGTEAGDKTYVALMQLTGAFASLQDIKKPVDDKTADRSAIMLQIMEAQGLSQQALNLKRQTELMLMDEETRALNEKLDAALREKAARELATRQSEMMVQILQLEGKTAEAAALQHKLEMAATEEGLRPLAERVYQLQQENAAAEVAARHRTLDIELMRALGNEEGALAAERADALKGMDAYEQGVTQKIWAAEAAREAAAKAKAAAEAEAQKQQQAAQELAQAMQKQADEAKAAYDQKISADRAALQDAYNAESAAVQQVIDKMGNFAQAARALQESLRFGSDSALTRAQKFAVAQNNMPNIIASARSGDVAAVDQLKQYVELLKASASSSDEYVVGVAKVIAILDGAADTAETQESIAKSHLSMLKKQVDVLLGVDKSVMSVSDAIAQLNTDLQGGLAGVAGAVYGQYLANKPASASKSTTTGMTPDQIYGGLPGEGDLQAKRASAIALNNARVSQVQKYIDDNYAKEAGYNPGNMGNQYYLNLNDKYYGAGAFANIARELGIFAPSDLPTVSQLPSFDVGTNYVPQDMLALIHEGEKITPKAYNHDATFEGSLRTQLLEELVESLTEEVKGLRAEARATAISNSKIEYVMRRMLAPEGDAMATREVPA